ncbi:hypothetical protein Cgig2_007540 [Carnegiea gigantea]|uniref:Uncharacterized protein n=1 Tax=Carnegiea gigantea TaxID=171969 RepID=A0A9Q1QDZ3_9CARY|nr:hypothetical protein Cgig2_007540 [Carnegiea gigantea]
MLENNEITRDGLTKEFFKWSYNETLVLCDVIIQCIMKNGHQQYIKWCKIKKERIHLSKSSKIKVSSSLEEKWEHIYGGAYATGKNICVPTMEPPVVNIEEQEDDHQTENHMEERLGEERNLHIRQSRESAMLGAQIKHMVASYKIMSQEGPGRRNKQQSSMSTIAVTMQIVNRMVENQILEKGGDFWFYATYVLKDAMKREIFLNIDDDVSRLKWLQYLHRVKDN